MNVLRHARFVASLLLCLQSFALARGAVAQRVVCTCTHGADVPCGCPMHARAEADDAKLPPCHRHRAHASKQGANESEKQLCFRARCTMAQPALTMLLYVGLLELPAVARAQLGAELSSADPPVHAAPFPRHETPPPIAAA